MTRPTIADLKALIVDDHLIVRTQMERALKHMGFTHVDQAPTAGAAVDKMIAVRYDVIFIDWHMPGTSGYDLMQQFREDRNHDRVAFVIVSVDSEERSISKATKAGAIDYVVKPVTESALHETVRKVLDWLEGPSSG